MITGHLLELLNEALYYDQVKVQEVTDHCEENNFTIKVIDDRLEAEKLITDRNFIAEIYGTFLIYEPLE